MSQPRAKASWGWPAEPHTTWSVRKTNVMETHASIWKCGWQHSSALGCWDSDKRNAGWSPVYFIFKVSANVGAALVVLGCHASGSTEAPPPLHCTQGPRWSPLHCFLPFPVTAKLGDCKDPDWLSCRHFSDSIWKAWPGSSSFMGTWSDSARAFLKF